jgi:hypothetical protein
MGFGGYRAGGGSYDQPFRVVGYAAEEAASFDCADGFVAFAGEGWRFWRVRR